MEKAGSTCSSMALVVELKAVESLAPIHVAQVVSYLKASRLHLGLLITFNVPQLRRGVRRVVLSRPTHPGSLGALGGLAVRPSGSCDFSPPHRPTTTPFISLRPGEQEPVVQQKPG